MHYPANQFIDYKLTKDPMDLSQLLLNLGLNVASNAIYDIVRFALRRGP